MTNPSSPSAAASRRDFIKALAAGAAVPAAGALALTSCQTVAGSHTGSTAVTKGDVILFQGDSITDAGRSRDQTGPNDQPALGSGYAWLAASELLVDNRNAGLRIYNRGVSGNKVYQLAERWDKDCLELQPNLLSILIGVNDFWHTLNGNYHGTVEIYERDYRALLQRTFKALPKVKLVICEPFVLRYGAVNDKWFPEFDNYRAAAKRVAETFHAIFIPFQSMFNEAVKYAPPDHWAKDGVHPTPFGAALMAHEWLRSVGKEGA